jgi:hypothetical protein
MRHHSWYFVRVGICGLCFSILMGALCPKAPLAANGAPAQLLNKTINIAYSVNVTFKTPSGRVLNSARHTSATIYVSNLGRVFARQMAAQASGRASEASDKGPGETTMRFQNGALVGVIPRTSGAVQVTVSFSSGFQSCTVEVLVGKENGKPYKWTGLDGVPYEAVGPITVSGQSCSIKEGNPFAGERRTLVGGVDRPDAMTAG